MVIDEKKYERFDWDEDDAKAAGIYYTKEENVR